MCPPLSGVPSVEDGGIGVAPRAVGGRIMNLELPLWVCVLWGMGVLPAGDTSDRESGGSGQPLRTSPQPLFPSTQDSRAFMSRRVPGICDRASF